MRSLPTIPARHAVSARLPMLLPMLLWALLTACAGVSTGEPVILIETAARGQPVAGAACVATVGPVCWDVKTPAVLAVGGARGELHVICEKPGFRPSELIFRAAAGGYGTGVSAGFGGGIHGSSIGMGIPLGGISAPYPRRLVIDLNPA